MAPAIRELLDRIDAQIAVEGARLAKAHGDVLRGYERGRMDGLEWARDVVAGEDVVREGAD